MAEGGSGNGASAGAASGGAAGGEGQVSSNVSTNESGGEVNNEASNEASVENSQAKETKVSKLFEQSKTWFPDREFKDDDEFQDHFITNYNELSEYKNRNLKAQEKVLETLKVNPELGEIIKETSKGVPFTVALARHVDLSNIQPQEGDVDYDAYSQAYNERLSKLKETDEYNQKVEKNQEESKKAIKAFFESKQMDEAQVKEFSEFVDGIYSKMSQGIIDADVLTYFYNAKNFDSQLSEAKKIAEISAKNAEIDLKKKDTKQGDGLPVVGQGSKINETTKEKGPLDDMFARVEQKNNIFN